jgi:hypothetical protein
VRGCARVVRERWREGKRTVLSRQPFDTCGAETRPAKSRASQRALMTSSAQRLCQSPWINHGDALLAPFFAPFLHETARRASPPTPPHGRRKNPRGGAFLAIWRSGNTLREIPGILAHV